MGGYAGFTAYAMPGLRDSKYAGHKMVSRVTFDKGKNEDWSADFGATLPADARAVQAYIDAHGFLHVVIIHSTGRGGHYPQALTMFRVGAAPSLMQPCYAADQEWSFVAAIPLPYGEGYSDDRSKFIPGIVYLWQDALTVPERMWRQIKLQEYADKWHNGDISEKCIAGFLGLPLPEPSGVDGVGGKE